MHVHVLRKEHVVTLNNSQDVCLISLVLHSRLLVANDIKNSLHIYQNMFVLYIIKIYSIDIASYFLLCIYYISYYNCLHTVLVIEQ